MHIKQSPLLTALLLVSSFNASALQLESGTGNQYPAAKDDYNSTVIGLYPSASGNVSSNDRNGSIATFNGSSVGQYGLITSFESGGAYTYELFTSTDNASLPSGGVGIDSFTYTYANESGQTDTARLIIDVNPDPAFTVPDDGQPYDNVDIEFNNRSEFATTPLESGRNIKGHLYNSDDKDWYLLGSAGNEIITLEVCPKGTSCFGKKSWVLYVFDAALLNALNDDQNNKKGEFENFPFTRWVDETGSDTDLLGNQIISSDAGSSNHMYLAYNAGFFEGALIGIVAPCFDTLNTVDIGVPPGEKNYLIAISSP